MTKPYPATVCHSCGTKFCKSTVNHGATFYLADCQCCGILNTPCTEPRDYGGFKQWPLPRDLDPNPAPLDLVDLIEPVLDTFDFEKVRKAMELLDWTWLDSRHKWSVPTVEQLRNKARNLLICVIKADSDLVCSTGGLEAEKIVDENPMDCGLTLKFILQSSEHYIGDYHDEETT